MSSTFYQIGKMHITFNAAFFNPGSTHLNKRLSIACLYNFDHQYYYHHYHYYYHGSENQIRPTNSTESRTSQVFGSLNQKNWLVLEPVRTSQTDQARTDLNRANFSNFWHYFNSEYELGEYPIH